MSKCINTSLPEFIQLREATNLPSIVLEMRISKWQEDNNTDRFPTVDELNDSNVIPSKSPIFNEDGTRKKWLEKDYDKVVEVIKPLNKKFNNQFEIIKTTGEKGDKRVYYSIAVKEGKYTKDTNSVNILNDIASSNHPLNKVAKQLIPFAEKNNVPVMFAERLFISEDKKDIAFNDNTPSNYESIGGVYLPKQNIIYASTKTLQRGSQEALIIHEIIHSLSFKELRENQEMLDDFERLRKYAVESLKDVTFNKYGLTDADEFMVALYTDGKLIKELMKLPPLDNQKKYKNLLEEIFDYILSLFNIGKDKPTLFNQAFDLSTQFLDYTEANIEIPFEEGSLNDNMFLPNASENIDDYFNNVKDEYKGKLIFVATGLGKSYVADNINIIDADTVMAKIMGVNVANIPTYVKNNSDKVPEKIEQYKIKLRKLVSEGKTVLTPNIQMIDEADYIFSSNNPERIIKDTSSATRENPYKSEYYVNKIIEETKTSRTIYLKDDEYISNILLKKNIELDKTIKNLNDSIDVILEKYLNQFGVVVKDVRDSMNIDSLGFADILSKIAYIKDRKDLPKVAGEFIAYMMQFNPLMNEIFSDLKFDSTVTMDVKTKAVGKLLQEYIENKNKTDTGIVSKIKRLFDRFMRYIKKIDIPKINNNLSIIYENVIRQNKHFIAANLYKPGSNPSDTMQVSLLDAMKSDELGKEIIEKMTSEGFLLTGSVALAEQGTIYRPSDNLLHDVDFVSSFTYQETLDKFNKIFPINFKAYQFQASDYITIGRLVSPKDTKIVNLEYDKNNIFSKYQIEDDKGNIVGTFEKIGKQEVVTGVHGKVVDMFKKFVETDSVEINNVLVASWKSIFSAKLKFARIKDIWDYNRFIPNENKPFLYENSIFSQEEVEQDYRYQIQQDTLTREMFKEQFPTLGLNDNQIDNVIAAIESGDITIKCNL